MPRRRIRIPASDVAPAAFEAIRREADVPASFPAAVEAEAAAAANVAPAGDRVDLPFVTIDPPGSRDLDQALHIEASGGGHRIHYAIADVSAFVAAGGALDRETHERGVTIYAPDARVPLHPPVLSEGAASLLPGEWRPALLWTLELDSGGELTAANVERRVVRSVAQHTYADVPPELEPLLREVGERRLALERARGGVRLAVPEQEVVAEDGSWTVHYRAPLPAEEYNAQVSLLTGMAAAEMMLSAGAGILRTQPEPDARDLARLREQARALRVQWPSAMTYPEFVRSLDPALPAHAALMHEATGVGRGAGYTAFDGQPPEDPRHFAIAAPYAHATAPLRRLQDRYVAECCLAAAGAPLPGWVRAALPELPAAMAAADKRARTVERAAVDLVEALLLAGREGERFEAVVIDDGLVQLREPAVRARLGDGACPAPGSEVAVVLERSDPAKRAVSFSVASGPAGL